MRLVLIIITLFIHTACRSLGALPSVVNGIDATNSIANPEYNTSNTLQEQNKKLDTLKVYDPTPDIGAYSYSVNTDNIIYRNSDVKGFEEFAKEVKISTEINEECRFVQSILTYHNNFSVEEVDGYLKVKAADAYGNYVRKIKVHEADEKVFIEADIYSCPGGKERFNPTFNKLRTQASGEFDLLVGGYVNRTGFLKLLGEVGPTFGFTYSRYSADNLNSIEGLDVGWHIHFNLDHFTDTDSTFLKPKFTEEDFTNYLWSIGPSLRYIPNDYFQMNYHLGLGINFLEIDTNRRNPELTDAEATRTTASFVHQLGFHLRIKNAMKYSYSDESDVLIGLNSLYYWMPNALGEFADNNTGLESYGGGSYAIFFSIKWQSL